jgi:hypothetical protein
VYESNRTPTAQRLLTNNKTEESVRPLQTITRMKDPKEKAKELMLKFYHTDLTGQLDAKECALICVNEIMAEIIEFEVTPRVRYWQQVKTEINNL